MGLRGINGLDVEDVRDCLRKDTIRPLPADFDSDDYQVPTVEPTRIVEDGDEIDLGGRHLRVLHTPGHCCLFDPIRGHLFSGDLVYKGPLLLHFEQTDLEAFAESVSRIADLNGVKRVLP